MIRFENVSKSFGKTPAVAQLDFEIPKGEIVGFLGPNGAGKTTTMRLMAGFLRPSQGRIYIDGRCVVAQRHEVQAGLGYLPESCPLYDEMTVLESLETHAALRKIPRAGRGLAMSRVIEELGLEPVLKKWIAQLSKGFRQRLGLAQALIHDPPFLILDEPTTGLDPNQIGDMKRFIQSLAGRKTILFSTHTLHYAAEICDRLLMIHQGRMVFNGSPRTFTAQSGQQAALQTTAPPDAAGALFKRLHFVSDWRAYNGLAAAEWYGYELAGDLSAENLGALNQLFLQAGWAVARLQPQPTDIEQVFAQKTRRGAGLE